MQTEAGIEYNGVLEDHKLLISETLSTTETIAKVTQCSDVVASQYHTILLELEDWECRLKKLEQQLEKDGLDPDPGSHGRGDVGNFIQPIYTS